MPQIANQDYNFIDLSVLPRYEAVERLYRAYLNGTALDCVIRVGKKTEKVITYEEKTDVDTVLLEFNKLALVRYVIKAPLTADLGNRLMFNDDVPTYIVSADGFKLNPIVKDGVLTGVEVTTEKVEKYKQAQYFKDWMIGQPVGGGK